MEVQTSRFGVVEVDAEEIIIFSSGIPPFEDLKEFFLYPAADNLTFFWLQALHNPQAAFLLADPFKFFPGYEVDLPEELLKELAIEAAEEVLVLVTVSAPRDNLRETTVNLAAPVVINVVKKRGAQLAIPGSDYDIKQPLFVKENSPLAKR